HLVDEAHVFAPATIQPARAYDKVPRRSAGGDLACALAGGVFAARRRLVLFAPRPSVVARLAKDIIGADLYERNVALAADFGYRRHAVRIDAPASLSLLFRAIDLRVGGAVDDRTCFVVFERRDEHGAIGQVGLVLRQGDAAKARMHRAGQLSRPSQDDKVLLHGRFSRAFWRRRTRSHHSSPTSVLESWISPRSIMAIASSQGMTR